MTTLDPTARRELRARAHHLHPVVAIGAQGLTPAVLHEVDVALTAHELIKIRVFSDDRALRANLLEQICSALACAAVQQLGKLLIVWRSNPEKAAAAKRKPARKAPAGGTANRKSPAPASVRTRIAAPQGKPRAPSRRQRGQPIPVADERSHGESDGHDSGSRRRRQIRKR